jgi:hypothetical protein
MKRAKVMGFFMIDIENIGYNGLLVISESYLLYTVD